MFSDLRKREEKKKRKEEEEEERGRERKVSKMKMKKVSERADGNRIVYKVEKGKI